MRRSILALALSLAAAATPQAPAEPAGRRDLLQDERRGGHTLARHVGRSDEDLLGRLQRERRISAASTYSDRSTAEQVVGETLARHDGRVRGWARRGGARPNLVLDFRGNPRRVIGRSLRRGRSRPEPCVDAVVVLKWRDRDFFVLTSYPEVRR